MEEMTITELLTYLEWKQVELARRIDVKPLTVNRWVRGVVPVPRLVLLYLNLMALHRRILEEM